MRSAAYRPSGVPSALCLLVIAAPVLAVDYSWNDPSGGLFTDPQKWTPYSPPAAVGPGGDADTVNFNLGVSSASRYTITGVAGRNHALRVDNDALTMQVVGIGLQSTSAADPGLNLGLTSGATADLLLQKPASSTSAMLVCDYASIATAPGSTAVLTLVGMHFNSDGGGLDVGVGGSGTMAVHDGCTVVSSANNVIGDLRGASGTITLAGAQTTFSASVMTIGRQGTGAFLVSNSAHVSGSATLGSLAGSAGTVTVTGAHSTWTGNLTVGDAGTGTFNVLSGGNLSGMTFTLGASSSGVGTALVRGTGSKVTATTLTVGQNGHGALVVEAGGVVTSSTIAIGSAAGTAGSIQVSGAGSTLSSTLQPFTVGGAGNGTLSVTSGGQVNSLGAMIGNAAGVTGSVSVTGAGSAWDAGLYGPDVTLGNYGSGRLTIAGGGAVTSRNINLGVYAGATGTVLVTGAGSTWNAGFMHLGTSGSSSLRVEAGATLTSSDAPMAEQPGSTSVATVTDPGSTWNAGYHMKIGAGGPATLNILNQGLVRVREHVILYSQGTVNLDGGTLETFDILDEGGKFNWTSGTLHLTGALSVAPYGYFGSSLLLTPDQHLVVDAGINIGSGGTFYSSNAFSAGPSSIAHGGQMLLAGPTADFGPNAAGSPSLLNHGDLVFTHPATVTGIVTNAADGAITALADVTFNRLVNGPGSFHGAGTITFAGGLSPGFSPAVVSFDSSVALASTNQLLIELAGTAKGQFDELLVGGNLALDGTLKLSLLSGFQLGPNERFTIAQADGVITGHFAGLPDGARVATFGGYNLLISYPAPGGHSLELYTVVPEPAAPLLAAISLAGLSGRRRRRTASPCRCA